MVRWTGKSPLPFQMSSAAIRGNRENPGLQRSASIPPPQMPYGPQQGGLRDILGVVTVPQHPEAEAEHDVLEPLDQLPDSLGISRETAANEFAFVVHLALLSRHHDLPDRNPAGFVGCNFWQNLRLWPRERAVCSPSTQPARRFRFSTQLPWNRSRPSLVRLNPLAKNFRRPQWSSTFEDSLWRNAFFSKELRRLFLAVARPRFGASSPDSSRTGNIPAETA